MTRCLHRRARRASGGGARAAADAGMALLGLSTSRFAWLNAGLVAGWLVTALLIAREHRKPLPHAAEGRPVRED